MEKQKQKIFYVITKSNWGGAQKYVYDLATSLPKDSFEPTVIFGGVGALAEKLSSAHIKSISIDSLKRDISISSDFVSFFKLFSIFRKEHPDIVHVNSSKVGGLGALAARLVGIKKIIFTCHGWPFNEERGTLSLWVIRFFSWLTVMLSHKTIMVSERDLHDGKLMFGLKNKLILIHNGLKKPDFKTTDNASAYIKELARKSGVKITPEDFLVGSIGELHKNKGYDYLLSAFSKLGKSFKLVIISDGEERFKLNKKIHELGLGQRVALLGFVTEAATYLEVFDAFVLSSIKEGLPYVIIEAGFAKLPVVATNVGGVSEIIDDMHSGILVQNKKPGDIAKSLEFIRVNPEKVRLFGENLYNKVMAEFSLSTMVEKTVELYESK